MYYGNIDPTIGADLGLAGFTAAVLGGLGSLPGAVVGGLLLGVAESFGVTWFGGSARQLVSFAVLIGVLWLRPNGLLGTPGTLLREPLTGTFFGGGGGFRLRPWHVGLLLVVGLGVVPLAASDYLLQVGAIVAIFAALALSLTLVAGTAGQVSLGQAGVFAIGAYTSALLSTERGWGFWPALLTAGLVAAVLGAVTVAPALRLRGHYVAIATLGIGSMVVAVILNWEWLTNGPLGVFAIPPPELLGQTLVSARAAYGLAVAVLLVCAGLVWRLQGSHLGLAWRSIREDETAARSVGVEPSGNKALAFAVGGFAAGLAGALLAHQYSFIAPDVFTFQVSLLALTIVVLGGMSSIVGAVLAAVLLVGLPEFFRPLQEVRILAYGVVLLLLVRFRPQGLMGFR
jgi:branched-chain amino acid transport system permease protein